MNIFGSTMRLLLGKRLPVTSGELRIPGLTSSITIYRDRYGVPHIEAANDLDGVYALGFCQGQDRAFQLEMLLRVTRGTLSELVGADALVMDRLSRRIGFFRAAEGHYRVMPEADRYSYDAFARGVTDGMVYGCSKTPHEFALLRSQPTPWTGVDALAGMNYIGFGLSTWSAKLARHMILQMDGPEAVAALDGDYAAWHLVTKPVNTSAGPAIGRLNEDMHRLVGVMGMAGGSNNWTLRSSKTASGRPLLANDPHLGPALPAPWYLVQIRTPQGAVIGASFVGGPVIAVGHNDLAAWGVTAGVVDNIDLFVETLGPDGKSVQEGTEDNFVPCEVLHASIPVKGKPAFEEDILITPRGPVVSDVLDGVDAVISMQATWMAPRPAAGIPQLHTKTDFPSFQHALGEVYLSSLNLVYADTSDTIGWQLTGEVPDRVSGSGMVPMPGWDPQFQWRPDNVPFTKMPSLVNPEAGFIATANNQPVQDGDGPYLGRDWLDGYRHARIVEQLASRDDWDLPKTQALQVDQFAIPWREMKAVLLETPAATEAVQVALDLLREWDGVTGADSAPAAVFEYFVLEMLQRAARAKAPNAAQWVLGVGFHPLLLFSGFNVREVSRLVALVRGQPEGWFPGGWDAEIAAALEGAVGRLRQDLGPDPVQWAWGKVHQLVLEHPMGLRQPLDKVFNRGPYPTGGDHTTVAQAGREASVFGSNVTGLANLRMGLDVGNWENNYFVIAGGQSGNPFSPHYDDLLGYWLRNEAVTLPWSQEAVRAAAKATLTLVPGG